MSVTAISADTFWMLGTAPCEDPPCTSIVATTRGGRGAAFFGLPAPRAPLSIEDSGRRGVADLRFANDHDGFAFGPDLYVTHDGAATWARVEVPGKIEALEAAAGRAFAVVARGGRTSLMSTEVSSDGWRRVALPRNATPFADSLALHGRDLWVMAGGGTSQRQLFHSSDQGKTFESLENPCDAQLGARLAPTDSEVVWGLCVTGMQASVVRSRDGGQSFSSPVPEQPELPNSSVLGARGEEVAYAGGACGPLFRLPVAQPAQPALRGSCSGARLDWSFAGFTDAENGFAARRAFRDGRLRAQMWHTTDGGVTWTELSFKGD